MKDINLTLPDGSKELIIRTGDADKIVHPESIEISGILAAPYQFLEGKQRLFNAEDCHLQIKKDAGMITLVVLDTDPHTTHTITGKLEKDNYFSAWGINTEKRWTVQSFLKHVKMQKTFFAERTEADAITESLRKWEAQVETVVKEHTSTSGNSLSMLERKVSNITLKNKFKLNIPIFQGYSKQGFEVEIGFDPKATSVDLYLVSEDLFALEIEHREALINSELDKFKDFACSKVVLS